MPSTIRPLVLVALALLVSCGGKSGDTGGDTGTALPDGAVGPDGTVGPDGPAATICPNNPQQGESCNVDPALDCPGLDMMAFSCGLQTCRCTAGAFDCTPFSLSGTTGCGPFDEGDGCSFEGNPGCDMGEPVSGAVTCKNGEWVYWTACHGECPMSYDESLPGTPCSFTPDEGACSWSSSYETCTCRDGKFDCS